MNTPQFNTQPIADLMTKAINKLNKTMQAVKPTTCEALEDNLTETEFRAVSKYITVEQARRRVNSITDALLSFNWSETKEGRAFWANIYSRFEN